MIPKRESELKSSFHQKLQHRFPALLMLQFSTAGAPDRGYVLNSRLSCWEFKHGTPDFECQPLQELFCMRLEAQGIHCRYVVWEESATYQHTMIVRPSQMRLRSLGRSWLAEKQIEGFDNEWLIREVERVHLS